MQRYAITWYRNACQTPRSQVKRVHRSGETGAVYLAARQREVARDGYSHGYGLRLVEADHRPKPGDDADDFQLVAHWNEQDGEWDYLEN
jgi:hypothetical protein